MKRNFTLANHQPPYLLKLNGEMKENSMSFLRSFCAGILKHIFYSQFKQNYRFNTKTNAQTNEKDGFIYNKEDNNG